jgi:tRNA nucleotidyltransferase (CCA-adding enzyme)
MMIPNELKEIANRIEHFGGKAFIVGGFVRDMVLGLKSKDIDVEVFGMGKGTLKGILSEFGKVDVVGQSFGVIKLTTDDNDFDFSLPRRESKSGKGHKGFIVECDSSLTPKEAAERRDFTFNALMMDIETGQILDFFGGVQDLTNKTIKATSEHFKDDPLRVLRGFQFVSRFGLVNTAFDTIEMCIELVTEFDTLSKERLWIEFEKWASKSIKPSLGLQFLATSGWLNKFTDLLKTESIMQDNEWHPELWLWEHQKQAVDLAVEFAQRENLTKEERLVLVFAALCHDFGKVTTTELCEDGHIRSKGHDKAGVEPTKNFLESIDAPKWLIEQVCALVSEHMFNVHCRKPTARSIRRLARRVKPSNIKMLALLMEIDASARFPKPRCKPIFIDRMLELAQENDCQEDEVKPLLMGRHLIALGMKPGREFGVILAQALQEQLDGTFDSLDGAIEWMKGNG